MSRIFQPHIVTDDSALGGTIINGSLYKQSDQYLEKVFGSTGDRTKYTESIWVKRGGNDYKTRSVFGITCLSDPSYGYEYISFDSSDRLDWYAQSNGSSWSGWLQTKRKFRGTGWFHVVRVLDTSNSTSGDRLRLYVNGERVTEFDNANYPSSQAGMNRNTTHYLHRHIGTVNDSYSGYVTEHYYVDGLALDPSHFGYTESLTGEWRPKKYQTPSVDNHFNWALNNNITDALNGTAFTENGGSSSFVSAGSNSFGLTNSLDISGGKYLSYAITPASQWTIDFYVKLDNFTGANSYIGGWNGTGGNNCCVGVNKDNAPNYYFVVWGGSGNLYQTGVTVSLNTWYHIRITSNATNNLRLYIDGTLRATDTSSNQNPATPLTFGDMQSGRFDGQIAGVRYITRDLGAPPSGGLVSTNGVLPNADHAIKYGAHGFYFPNDGSSQIGRDQSGNNNHWAPRNLNQGVTNIEKATGGLPILNTNSSGTVSLAGVRHDPLASYVVLALPLSGGSTNSLTDSPTTGQDFSKLINGSTTEKQTDNNGDIASVVADPNFYGSSVYFANTNSDIMNVRELNSGSAGSNDFEFTGDYCIEMYVNPRDFGAVDGSLWVTSNGSQYHAFNLDPGNNFNIYFNSGSATWQPSVSNLDYNNWNHVALTREGSTVRLFVNGLLAQDTTSSGTHGYGQGSLARVGGGGSNGVNAYIQDVRIYKGTAKYTTDFVCPFTRSQIRPDSPTGITPRTFNDNAITTQGSAMFDGVTSYMQLHTNAAFNFGTGDFTVEAYIWLNDQPGGHCQIFSNDEMDFKISGNPGRIRLYTSGGSYSIAVVPRRRWVHVAACRSSGTFYVAVDGKVGFSAGTGAPPNFSGNYSQAAAIGTRTRSVGNELFIGHISNLRVLKGTALYTSNFTPPTEPLTNITNTVLLGLQSSTDATALTVAAGGISNANGGNIDPVQASKFNPFDDIHNGALSTEYAVLNAQATFSRNCTFFNGGMDVTIPASNKYGRAFSSLEARSGKYYWEVTYTSSVGNYLYVGVGAISHNRPYYYIRGSDGEKSYHANGVNNNSGSTDCRFNVNDVIGVYLDLDAKKWYLTVNGVFQDCGNGPGNPIAGTGYVHGGIQLDYGYGGYSNGIGAHFANATSTGSQTIHVNFGQEPFKYPPLDGYKTLSVNNLNPSTINDPEKHFKAVTYTGDGATNRAITGLKFKPDLVWIKCRSVNANHGMINSVCEDGSGNKTMLYPNLNNSETVGGNFCILYTATGQQPLIDNGFRINNNNDGNGSGRTFVAWCWKAGGAAVTNNDGTTTSSVSANTEAGFSIVTYDGDGISGSTVGHGLNQAPEFMLVKARDRNDRYWINWHRPGGQDYYMDYNTNGTLIAQSSYNMFNNTAPDSTVITLGNLDNVNNSSNKYVIYCWHSVPGFSKVGHYRGTGDAHGPFVYTGFKPAMIWIKNYDITGEEWMIYDNARDSDNPNGAALYANQNYVESDGTQYTGGNSRNIDFLSHGFKITDTGNPINHPSGEDTDHVFIAFAEKPESSQFGGHNLSK